MTSSHSKNIYLHHPSGKPQATVWYPQLSLSSPITITITRKIANQGKIVKPLVILTLRDSNYSSRSHINSNSSSNKNLQLVMVIVVVVITINNRNKMRITCLIWLEWKTTKTTIIIIKIMIRIKRTSSSSSSRKVTTMMMLNLRLNNQIIKYMRMLKLSNLICEIS